MNLDDLKKQRPSLTAKTPKAPSPRQTISLNDLRVRFGMAPSLPPPSTVNAPKISDEDTPEIPVPPPRKK